MTAGVAAASLNFDDDGALFGAAHDAADATLRTRAARAWGRFTYKFRWVIVAVSVAGTCAGLPFATLLLDRTDNGSFDVHGSDSHQATVRLQRAFPAKAKTASVVLLEEAVGDGTLAALGPRFCEFEVALAVAIEAKYPCDASKAKHCFVRFPITSYCQLALENATYVAVSLVNGGSADGLGNSTAATFSLTYSANAGTTKLDELLAWFLSEAESVRGDVGLSKAELRLGSTGFDIFAAEGDAGTTKDLETVDTVSLPLALFVMALTLGSLPLLFIPLANMACTTVVEFVIMGCVAKQTTIATFVPSVMMTITLALSFDYSLFVCSRYAEAREGGLSSHERVVDVLRGAGHTISVSGSTLIACFLGLVCFPSALLRGIGIAVSVGLACAMVFNLTLSPAILHICGEPLSNWQDSAVRRIQGWLESGRRRCCGAATRQKRFGTVQQFLDDSDYAPLTDEGPSPGRIQLDAGSEGGKAPAQQSLLSRCLPRPPQRAVPNNATPAEVDDVRRANASLWYAGAKLIWDDRRVALALLIGVVALCAPACSHALKIQSIADPATMAPSPSAASTTYHRVAQNFGGGAIAPLTVLFQSRNGTSLLTQHAFEAMENVLFNDLGRGIASSTSLVRLAGKRLTVEDYAKCEIKGPNTAWCTSVLGLGEDLLDEAQTFAAASVLLSDSPYSTKGFSWIDEARETLKTSKHAAAFDGVFIQGAPATMHDLIDELYDSFPVVIGATLGLVFVLLGFAFQSLAVPLRSVAALCLTLSFSFGTCVLVYQRPGQQQGWQSFTTRGSDRGVSWLAPLICFSVIVGLALDYDVFLLARVYEYRVTDRLDDRRALLRAIEKTGVIITAAGMIMAISFGGLFLSDTTILNQTAWLLCSAVLFDTFVVRTLLMPSLCSLSRSYMWWPARLPTPVEDQEEYDAATTRFAA